MFNVEIFGTVADWTMILVTAITAYFLYETLKSQKDVQKDQEKINKLQTLEIRQKFKPIINFLPPRRFDDNFEFLLSVSNNPAFNVELFSSKYYLLENSPSFNTLTHEGDLFKVFFEKLDITESFTFGSLRIPMSTLNEIDNQVIDFILRFEDEFGFKYEKEIKISYNSLTYRTTATQKNVKYL